MVITNKTRRASPASCGWKLEDKASSLKTDIFAGIRLNISLQKSATRPQPNIQQGALRDARTIGQKLFGCSFSERVRHGHSVRRGQEENLLQRRKSKRETAKAAWMASQIYPSGTILGF